MLDDLKARIGACETATRDAASEMAERVRAKSAVNDLFAKAYIVLKDELEHLMQIFRLTESEFYNDYRAARVIKDVGVRHGNNNTAANMPISGTPK